MGSDEAMYCPVCQKPAAIKPLGALDLTREVYCERCGKFIIAELAMLWLDDKKLDDKRFKMSACLRERTISNQSIVTIVTSVGSTNNLPGPVIDIEGILDSFPATISQRLDRALQNLGRLSSYPGDRFTLNVDRDYPVLFAENGEACSFLGRTLEDGGVITCANTMGHINGTLTATGWNQIANMERAVGTSDQAFVAMWFSKDLEVAYTDGFERGVKAAGYKPLRIDLTEHNEKICDAIIAEIRKSRFVIADFTGHRGGVYFEAGFAMGLGMPVIWTCRKDHEEDLHFDTRQFNHILWEHPEDLYKKLHRRIEATIIR